jgi:hypothetical protein
MHRSGTSLCANILHEMGVDMADAQGASANNARGHWERPRINDLHDAVLALFGRPWNAPTHHLALPDQWWTDPRVEPIRVRLIAYLETRLEPGHLTGFKDPRTSRLLAMWPPILDRLNADPIYIFCIRNPAQVARSITARDSLPADQAAYRWLVYNAQAVHGVATAPVCVIPYEAWFTTPEPTLARLAAFINAPPNPNLAALIDTTLRHDALAPPDPVPQIATTLHQQIAATTTHFPPALQTLAETILACEAAMMPFLRDAALLPLSIAEQNRAIADLHALIDRLRNENKQASVTA